MTLIELLMVMGIIGVVTAMAWPVLDSALVDAKIQSAADQIRAALMTTRVRAIQDGMPYRFVWTASSYGYGPVTAKVRHADSFGDESPRPAGTGEDRLREALPESVRLSQPSPTPSLDVDLDEETAAALPIVFQPDGTTSDATWRVVGPGGRSIRIDLDGLTGRVKAQRLLVAHGED